MVDFIIIGAGSAGCVLANRLSADPANQVLLLEAGSRDWNPLIHMPAGVPHLLQQKWVNWYYETEPEPNCANRRLYWPRGKVLGGSSAINAMLYIRGQREDYDGWRQLGNPGWSFDDVLPYFKRAETRVAGGASAYRGGDGPLWVSAPRSPVPLYDAFVAAGIEAGHPTTDDFNGAQQEGFGRFETTTLNGKRCSAATAYLHPIKHRPNLRIETKAHVTRVLIESGRAIGVEYRRDGQTIIARAEREVILSGGAINSPQLLLLSGIGPAEELRRHGIPVIHDLPGVGANLQDHFDVTIQYECSQSITLDRALAPHRALVIGAQYFTTGTGIGAQNGTEAGAFLRSRPELASPDIQLIFVPALVIDHTRQRSDKFGYGCHVCQLRPESRGTITLHSSDPFAHPAIRPNYLATETDRRTMRDGVRITRNVLRQSALAPFARQELSPGDDSDAALDHFIATRGETIYHPVGTCKMGVDTMAVVDPMLRLCGISGLRVVDASIMPQLISGNTNAPTIMIAEKAADMILGLDRLASATADSAAPRQR